MNPKAEQTQTQTIEPSSKPLVLILGLLKPYFLLAVFIFILMGVDVFFEISIAWIQQSITDVISEGNREQFTFLIKVCSSFLLGILILLAIQRFMNDFLTSLLQRDMSICLFKTINKLPLKKKQSYHSADLVERINGDVRELSQIYLFIIEFITVVVLVTVSFFLLTKINMPLAIMALVSGPVIFFIGRFFELRIQENSMDLQKCEAQSRVVLQEHLQSIPIVKVNALERLFLFKYSTHREKQNALSTKENILMNFSNSLSMLVFECVYIAALFFIGLSAVKGNITPGAIVAFGTLIELVVWPVVGLTDQWNQINKGLGIAKRYFSFFDLPLVHIDKYNPTSSGLSANPLAILELHNVSYKHNSEKGLHHINMMIMKGERVALVGPSGAGKTTLARVLAGLYEPDEGSISSSLFKDSNQAQSLQDIVTYVTQNSYFIQGMIRENISLGMNVAEDEVIDAAKAAGAHDFIVALEHGYDTVLTEQGSSLSGGQRQRISLARAFLRDTPILILDEATASMDQDTESFITESIKSIGENKTIIVITHKMSTIADFSNIIVMEDGKLQENGSKHLHSIIW